MEGSMKKLGMILFFIVVSFGFVHSVSAEETFKINSKNVILYNLNDNSIIYEKNPDQVIAIASLTKMMTAIVSIELIESLDQEITLTAEVFKGLAEADASVAGFKVGEKVTYRDLLYGVLLPSGADATRALAIHLSGSEELFAELMNQKAKELGMINTHFVNTSGLDVEGHYSTVRDVAILMKYALQNETFKNVFTTKSYVTSNKRLTLRSTVANYGSRYGIDVSNIIGSKTGYTEAAGLCLGSIAEHDGISYLLVTAGAVSYDGLPSHVLDANTIYNYYFNNYSYKEILKEGQPLVTIPSYGGGDGITIYAKEPVYKYISNDVDLDSLSYQYIGENKVNYGTSMGTNLGTVSILNGTEILDVVNVDLTESVSFDLWSYLKENAIVYGFIGLFSYAILGMTLRIFRN